MATHQILRVDFSRDVTDFIVASLREEVLRADLFAEESVVYVAGHERRARDVRRKVGASFPEGTPERVARDLLKRFAPEIELRGGVERDFDFFAYLHDALAELKSTRGATRALVDELLGAWRRMADALSPDQRTPQAMARWRAPLGERGKLLAAVAGRYQSALNATRRDIDDVLWIAAEMLPRWRKAGFAPELVLIDELDTVSAARSEFLRALLACGKRGLCVLRGSGETLPFLRPALETMQAIVVNDFGGNARASVDGQALPRADLCEAWLKSENSKLPASVSLRRPATRSAEIRDTARAIKRLVRGGANLDDIAVVLPISGNYRGILESTFASAGIPFDAPLDTPLAQSPPVAALLELLRAARGGLERAELLDALASPLLPFGDDVEEPQRAKWLGAIEKISRAAEVVGGTDAERDWLAPMRNACSDEDDQRALTRLLRVLELLAPFTRREMKPVAFFYALKSLAEASHIARVVKRPHSLRNQHVVGLHEFGKLCHEMSEGFARIGNGAMAMGDLVRALGEQAQTRTLRPTEPKGPHVRVLGLKEMRGACFEYVIVLGLTDEDLPLSEQDSMFFSRALEERLAKVLDERSARALCVPVDAPAQAEYLFANVLTCGAKGLTLSLPKAQGDKPFVPAAQLARLLSGAGVDMDKLAGDADASPVSAGELALSAGMALREVECGAEVRATLPLAGTLRAGVHGRAMELARDDETSKPGRFEGWVQSARLAPRFGASAEEALRHTFSPSQIDTYSDCPMRFWMRYVLHIKQPDEPTRDTPPTAVGSLVHHIFEAFVHAVRRELGQPAVLPDPLTRPAVRVLDLGQGDASKARARACELMLEAIEVARAEVKPKGPFWAGTLNMLAAGLSGQGDLGAGLLARFIDHELERNAQGLGIRFVELQFNNRSKPTAKEPDVVPEPVALQIPGGFVRLQGSIDRVDEGPGGLQIIDYKTGGAKTTADICDGAAFQLPIYLAAVSAKTGVSPNGMAYFLTPPLKPVEFKDVTKKGKKQAFDVGELVNVHLPRRLGAMLDALSRGVFVHLPSRPASGDKSPCGYCEFAAACALRDDVVAARQLRAETDATALHNAYRPDLAARPCEEEKS